VKLLGDLQSRARTALCASRNVAVANKAMTMIDTIAQRLSICAALSPFFALFSWSNAALAETWYCTLQDDPTIAVYGQKIEAYRVDGGKVVNLTDAKESKELFDKKEDKEFSENMKTTYEFNILRNDEVHLVAETQYDWNKGININIITIDKGTGSFLSSTIFTWDHKNPTQSKRGVCTKGFD
jgi:hypothetical protein